MDTEWMARGNCAHESPSTFFPSDGVGVGAKGRRVGFGICEGGHRAEGSGGR